MNNDQINDDFLPAGYEIPTSPSNYMNFTNGLNQIRILSSAVVGFVYFNKENKPVRSKVPFSPYPKDVKKDGKVKAFWAFFVWNYQLKMVQVLEITQKGIMVSIESLMKNPKWGNPKMYDIAITKSGEKMETKYNVQGEPPIGPTDPSILAEYNKLTPNLQAYFTGGDLFSATDSSEPVYESASEELGVAIEDALNS